MTTTEKTLDQLQAGDRVAIIYGDDERFNEPIIREVESLTPRRIIVDGGVKFDRKTGYRADGNGSRIEPLSPKHLAVIKLHDLRLEFCQLHNVMMANYYSLGEESLELLISTMRAELDKCKDRQ